MKLRSGNSEKTTLLILQVILLAGLLLRIAVYLQDRSLFLDEVNLARNIADRPFSRFFAPLDHQQYAPPLFLLLEKINWLLAGPSGWSLRCWPLIMGCLALWLFYRLSLQIARPGLPHLLVFSLFSFSAVYVRYATEVKQYSTDMAVSTFLIWLALRRNPLEKGHNSIIWALAGSMAIWMSMPSVFLLAGIGVFFCFRLISTKDHRKIGWLLLPGLVWVLQFGVYYYLILGKDLQESNLLSYHQTHFWPLVPQSGSDWQRMGYLIRSLSSTLIGHTVWAIALGGVGLLSGVFFSWKKQPTYLFLLLLPVLLCLLASGLGRYSLMERLTLFMMPQLSLLLLYGLYQLWALRPRLAGILLLLAFLPVLPLRKGLGYLLVPLQLEEMRPLVPALEKATQADDHIWVEHNANPAFIWYTQYDRQSAPEWPGDQVIYNRWDGLAGTELAASVSSGEAVWLVFAHLVSEQNQLEMQEQLASLPPHYGHPVQEMRFPGVTALLFQPK